MNRPPFCWFLALAAVTGFGYGLTAGRSGKSELRASLSASEPKLKSADPTTVQEPAVLPGMNLAAACQRGDRLQREAALLAFAGSLDEKGIRFAIEESRSLSPTERSRVLTALFERWAELSPEAAANAFLETKDADSSVLTAVALEWAARDPVALWEWARAQTRKDFPIATILSALAMQDAPQAWQWARTLDAHAFKTVELDTIFEQWGRRNGAEAVRVAQSFRQGSDRAAMRGAILGWARSDRLAALAAAQQIKDRETRDAILEDLFQNWSQQNPRAAMEAVLELPPNSSRNDLFFGVLRAVEERAPDALSGIAERLPAGAKKQRVLSLIAKRLAQTDVRAALAMAADISGSESRADALDDLGEAADFSQLADLRNLAAKLPRREDREATELGIAKGWASADPVAAVTWALAADKPEHRSRLLDIALKEWNEPLASLRWALGIPDESLRSIALKAAFAQAARTDPLLATDYFDRLPENQRADAAYAIADKWAESDPDGASTWVMQLRDSELDRKVIPRLVQTRLKFGTAETAAWLETLPVGDRRDTAVENFASGVSFADPQGALAWALTIANPRTRESAIEQVVGSWRQTDAAAALRWIKSTDTLTPQRREKLLQ